MYLHTSTLQSMCAVPNIAVFRIIIIIIIIITVIVIILYIAFM